MAKDPQKACGARPHWIRRGADEENLPPRLLCTRRRGHGGRHKDGRGHQWDIASATSPASRGLVGGDRK